MSDYESLLQLSFDRGFPVIEKFDIGKLKGLALEDGIGLSYKLSSNRERKCVLAEEIAHLEINDGDITDLSIESNCRQEIRAHKLAVKMLLPFDQLVDTIIDLREEATIYSLAYELDLTEDFIMEALEIYSVEYGPKKDYGAYVVYFNPFHVKEKQKI